MNVPPSNYPFACLALLLIFGTATAEETEQTTVALPEFDVVATTSTVMLDGNRKVLEFVHPILDNSSPEKREATYKPFHHVYSPDGSVLLTKGAGGLYTHHRGIFYGFSNITYGDNKKCDTWHCTEGTYQSFQSMAEGTPTAIILWHGKDGEAFALEQRSLQSLPTTVAGAEGTLLEFRSRLEPTDRQAIRVDGDPQHAGFQFRASQEVAEKTKGQTYFLRPAFDGHPGGKGELGETRNWNHLDPDDPINAECTNRPWTAMSFVVAGQRYTALYLDHPSNPKPARYSERDYGRFGSYFVASASKGNPLRVKYRIWIQAGEMTLDQCEAFSREFVRDVAQDRK